MTCRYVNQTSKLQIVRTFNARQGLVERTIFPGSQLVFDMCLDAFLEVSTYETPTSIVSDRIPCIQLRYTETLSLLASTTPVPASASLTTTCR